MSIKCVVVGSGKVAGEYLKAINSNSKAELYGIVTSDKERTSKRLGEMGLETRIYTDFAKVINGPQVDAVVLCSTPDVRPEQAALAAQNGKHMVLEKPVSLDREGMQTISDALDNNPAVKTAVSFVLRWNPAFEMIRGLIDDDALGRVFMAGIDYWHNIGPQSKQYRWSSTKALGGSSIMSAGCHAVDAIRYFAGEISEVTAYSCSTWADSGYEFDPNALAIFKLKNGGLAKVSSSLECKSTYKFNIHLLGEKGSVMNNRVYSHKFAGQTDYATIPTILPDSGEVTHHPFATEIDEFVDAIIHNRTTRCDFYEAFKTMDVCFAIDESIATGKQITLTDFR